MPGLFLSNEMLDPSVFWTALRPPLEAGMQRHGGYDVIRPRPLRLYHDWTSNRQAYRAVRSAESLFWMQLASRPEIPITAASLMAGRAHRAAYVIDAWPYILKKVGIAMRLHRVDVCFVAFREAFELLSEMFPRQTFVHMPFGVDTDVFRYREEVEKDVFCFWMGRRHEPLHRAIQAFCDRRGLRYVTSQGGAIRDPEELGRMISRSKYFVVTPPDVDHPQRAGGFSPLVMRYLEGAAAGTRLVGTIPASGEYEHLLPLSAILQVTPDGSDIGERFDEDAAAGTNDRGDRVLAERVAIDHSWDRRARMILSHLPH